MAPPPAGRALAWLAVPLALGFVLGGLQHYEGDPGLGILLAPIGAAALLVAVVVQLRAAWARER